MKINHEVAELNLLKEAKLCYFKRKLQGKNSIDNMYYI
jgi:hypothetical protein